MVQDVKERDTPFSKDDFVREYSKLKLSETVHILEEVGMQIGPEPPSLDEVADAYEEATEEKRLVASRYLDLLISDRLTACANLGDFVQKFTYSKPGTRIRVQSEDVWVEYEWDPLNIGTKVAVKCLLSFVAGSVNLSVKPKQTLREIFGMFGIPYGLDTLMGAMRTNDWYLHMESTDYDDVRLCFHNYYRVYDYREVESMMFHLIDNFVVYLEMIQGMSGVGPKDNGPVTRLPGYN